MCLNLFYSIRNSISTRLQKLQNHFNTPGVEAISALDLGCETLESQRTKSKATQLAPNALVNLFMRKSDITDYELRGSSTSLQIPFPRTKK